MVGYGRGLVPPKRQTLVAPAPFAPLVAELLRPPAPVVAGLAAPFAPVIAEVAPPAPFFDALPRPVTTFIRPAAVPAAVRPVPFAVRVVRPAVEVAVCFRIAAAPAPFRTIAAPVAAAAPASLGEAHVRGPDHGVVDGRPVPGARRIGSGCEHGGRPRAADDDQSKQQCD